MFKTIIFCLLVAAIVGIGIFICLKMKTNAWISRDSSRRYTRRRRSCINYSSQLNGNFLDFRGEQAHGGTDIHPSAYSNDALWSEGPSVNVDGSPMSNGIDINGNPYGVSSDSPHHS